MKRVLLFFAVLLWVVPEVWGETLYVSDFARVTLRSGPGVDYRVIAMISTGQKVEPLKKAEEWTKVRVSGGKEGWVMNRHLTSEPPSILKVERLTRANKAQREKLAEALSENGRLSERVKQLEKSLEATRTELAALKETHEALKAGAADYMDLKAKYEKAAAALEETRQQAERCEKDLVKLQLHQNIRWFLSGAGVLVVGFFIGFSTRRQRRRSSLL